MFEKAKSQVGEGRTLRVLDAEGEHDAMWEQGTPVADVILKSLNLLDSNS